MAVIKGELICDSMSDRIVETAEEIVTVYGAGGLTVRKILQKLDITNRVFYNRFRNVEEVLDIVCKNMIQKVRSCMEFKPDTETDFFESVTNMVIKSLVVSYDTKMQFNHYMFENDSVSQSNYLWWTTEIKKLIEYAKEKRFIKDVDSDALSYSIWCFCRGYNVDAVCRGLPKEEAIKRFKYSFSFFLEGLKA